MTEWWTGIAPAERTLECGGDRHRLRWEQGRLLALDHGDLGDERTLAALAGSELECVELAVAWERHRADLRALVIGPRGVEDLQADGDPSGLAARRAARRARATAGSSALPTNGARSPFGTNPDDDTAALRALTVLGGGFGERLVATVAAAWLERLRDGDPRCVEAHGQLQAALYGRIFAVLRAWLGNPNVFLELKLEMVGEGEPRRLSRDDDIVRVSLPFGWLTDVWARGLAITQGRFCLSSETTDGREWALQTIAPDLRTLERIALRIRD